MTIQSLTKTAVEAGCRSHYLNSANINQSNTSIFLGKPIRAAGRLVYAVACLTAVPAAGMLYHLGSSFVNFAQSTGKNEQKAALHAKAWKHFKAGMQDLGVLAGVITTIALFAFTLKIGVRNDVDTRVAGALAITAPLLFLCAFTLSPNTFEDK